MRSAERAVSVCVVCCMSYIGSFRACRMSCFCVPCESRCVLPNVPYETFCVPYALICAVWSVPYELRCGVSSASYEWRCCIFGHVSVETCVGFPLELDMNMSSFVRKSTQRRHAHVEFRMKVNLNSTFTCGVSYESRRELGTSLSSLIRKSM